MDLQEAAHAHAERFNDAVRGEDFTDFVESFTEKGLLRFDGPQLGPFRGRAAILKAYQSAPPSETISVWSTEEVAVDTVKVRFDWDSGGPGSFLLRWQGEEVAEMTMIFE